MAYWEKVEDPKSLPPNALWIGRDLDGDDVYVGRAHFNKELTPGKVIPKKGACFIPYKGHEIKMAEYEVLIPTLGYAAGSVTWVHQSKGKVPKRAIEAGYNADGIKLYVGRVCYNGVMVCGKIHPKYKVLYFPYDGQELTSETYEALTAN